MADGLLSNESAIEFFKHEVEDAMARQHLKTSELDLATTSSICWPRSSRPIAGHQRP